MDRNIAVILAGGTGRRLGFSEPKQFYKVAGKLVIEHTIDVFESNDRIDEISIVSHEAYISRIEELILKNNWRKVKKILIGGKERYLSSLSAIEAYKDEPNAKLIFHDAVRPLVSQRIVNEVIDSLETYNAVDVAIPTTDTIIEVNSAGQTITGIPNRSDLRRGQTPQGFRQKTIRKAYEMALNDNGFVSTDDCGTIIKYLPSEPVHVVLGEEGNMKLTYKEDTYLLDKLFQLKTSSIRLQSDYSELLDKVIVVFGGNSGIGLEMTQIAARYGAKVYSFSRSTTQTDVSNREDVRKALEQVYSETQRIDYVVNCAAILIKEPLIQMSDDKVDTIIETNYNGTVYVSMASYPYLKASKGQLLLFTSSSYTRGRAYYSLYSSTKCAVVNLMQALSQEWDIDGIRVNVINPERTATPMRTKNFGIEPAGSLLDAHKVAQVSIDTLMSSFTGQVIDVKKTEN